MKLLKVGMVANATQSIGYKTILKALAEPEMLEICTPVILGVHDNIDKALAELEPEQPLPLYDISNADDILDGRINVIGKYTNEGEAIDGAMALFLGNHIDTIIDIPTEIMNSKDSKTLSSRLNAALGTEEDETLDWTIKDDLFLLLSSAETLVDDIRKAWLTLRKDCTLIKPRIAVLAKTNNTHEQIVALREEGIFAFGPFVADNLIEKEQYKHYDAIIVIDGDEDLLKLLDTTDAPTFGYISGLPVVFNYLSKMHEQSYQDLKTAIYTSINIYMNRKRYRRATSKPLEKQWIPRGKDDFKLDLSKEESE